MFTGITGLVFYNGPWPYLRDLHLCCPSPNLEMERNARRLHPKLVQLLWAPPRACRHRQIQQTGGLICRTHSGSRSVGSLSQCRGDHVPLIGYVFLFLLDDAGCPRCINFPQIYFEVGDQGIRGWWLISMFMALVHYQTVSVSRFWTDYHLVSLFLSYM